MIQIKSLAPYQLTVQNGQAPARTLMVSSTGFTIATSNGTLVRVMADTPVIEFVPIKLVAATITPDVETSHPVLTFEAPQDWITVGMVEKIFPN